MISAVGCGADGVPADAEVVDLPGATLLPGLVDTHVHLAFDAGSDPVAALSGRDDDAALAAMADAARAQLRAGVTTVRDLGDRDYLSLRLRDAAAEHAAGPLPTIVAAGPPVTTPGGHCHFLGGAASGVAGVRAAVREHVERGVDVIKVMASGGEMTPGSHPHEPQFGPAELRAAVEEAHRFGLPVAAHAHPVEAIRNALDAGVDGIEHCTFRTADGVYAPDELMDALVESGVAIGVLFGIAPSAPAPPPEILRLLRASAEKFRLLWERGAVVVVGTDAGIVPQKPHGVLPFGVEELPGIGATPVEALRAGTSVAARVCGLGHRKGRVAPGFDADLLAVDGDPLADLGVLHRPVEVVAGGRSLSPAASSAR